MAGDWIPIDVSLPGKPEVARLSAMLGKPIDEVLGMLIRFWVWCQAHTADGHLSGMDTAMVSAVSHVPERFLIALQKVGWFEATESGCFVPNFERWLSRGAKRRLQDRRRKSESKKAEEVAERSASFPQKFRKSSAFEAEKKRTTEEERREQNKSPPEWITLHTLQALVPSLAGADAERACAALNEWFTHLANYGKPPIDPKERAVAILRMFPQVEKLEEVINYAKANEYVSLRSDMASKVENAAPADNPVQRALDALVARGRRKEASGERG